MKPSSVAYNFINKYTDVLDESVEDFLRLMYMDRIQNRYAQEIVAMLNEANIETVDAQWRLFQDKFETICNQGFNKNEPFLDNLLNQMFNWIGLTYSDIKFALLDYSDEWEEDDQGQVRRFF